jgi:hypothetical protein
MWKEYKTPAWKIMVLAHDNSSQTDTQIKDIAFIAHHAIADGLSGVAFHKALLTYLYEASSDTVISSWPYEVPETITKAPSLEEAMHYIVNSIPTIVDPLSADETAPFTPWAGNTPFLESIDSYVSRASFITIPTSAVKPILLKCKGLGVTLTGMLHSLIVIYLAKAVPHAQGFRGVTPYSMRPFTNPPDLSSEEIVNHISYFSSSWRPALLSSVRGMLENSEEQEGLIALISKQYSNGIREEVANLSIRGPSMLNEISAIEDFHLFCEESIKQERGYTYELSNLGVVKLPENLTGGMPLLEKLIFTQCGMVVGLAIGCGVVSLVCLLSSLDDILTFQGIRILPADLTYCLGWWTFDSQFILARQSTGGRLNGRPEYISKKEPAWVFVNGNLLPTHF